MMKSPCSPAEGVVSEKSYRKKIATSAVIFRPTHGSIQKFDAAPFFPKDILHKGGRSICAIRRLVRKTTYSPHEIVVTEISC